MGKLLTNVKCNLLKMGNGNILYGTKWNIYQCDQMEMFYQCVQMGIFTSVSVYPNRNIY